MQQIISESSPRIEWLRTPSRVVLRAGCTSFTVRSARTPPTKRKHFRPGSSARASSRVDITTLEELRRISRKEGTRQRTCAPQLQTPALRSCSQGIVAHFAGQRTFAGSLASISQWADRAWDGVVTLVGERGHLGLCFGGGRHDRSGRAALGFRGI
jgi:hypothetical protein